MGMFYVKGDATQHLGPIRGHRVIVHVCNDAGGWGAGFTGALSRRWSLPENLYRAEYQEGYVRLGHVQFAEVEPKITVANMVAQHGYGVRGNQTGFLDRDQLRSCLCAVDVHVTGLMADASIHMPRIGCGLAGDSWENVSPIVETYLWRFPIYVYDLLEG